MFVDETTLRVSAGHGGNGIVSWRHEKGKDKAGPGGGDGGRGGDVYIKGVRDYSRLAEYRFQKDFRASNGENGKSDEMHGAKGDDLILEIPIGSVIKNRQTAETTEVFDKKPILFLRGGNGGYGNAHFKGPKNRRPREVTLGKEGESGEFFIELKLSADVGLIGLPNSGKSTLLNALTKARAKVGNYAFTTLNPNLGDMFGFIIADIPGLIEGASRGKGLGHKFLRHISRTKMILYCLSCEGDVKNSYDIVRNELKNYDPELLKKPEAVLLTKSDKVDAKTLEWHFNKFNKREYVWSVSVLDNTSVISFRDDLIKILKKI